MSFIAGTIRKQSQSAYLRQRDCPISNYFEMKFGKTSRC